jgi:hypothetical protein
VRESGIEFERNVRKFVLRIGRPSLNALQNLGEFFGLHGVKSITIPISCLPQRNANRSCRPRKKCIGCR